MTFIILCIACLYNSFEVIYIFDRETDLDLINTLIVATAIPRILFYIALGIRASTWRTFLSYTFILDPITFPMALAAYAYVVFFSSVFILDNLDYVTMTLISLLFVVYAAAFRVICVKLTWRKWQIISMKLVLFVAAGFYVVYGVRYIFPGINWTEGKQEDVDEAVKEFITLYVLGSADYIVKLYEKVCDMDKTADLIVDKKRYNDKYILNE